MPQDPRDEATLRRRATQAGQEHVFRFWDDIGAAGRARLLEELADVDFDELARLVREHLPPRRRPKLPPKLDPAPFIPLPQSAADHRRRDRMRRRGQEILSAGRAGALTVAGGQGTRLGYDGPKGTFPIGPVSRQPLFQIFAEGILAARRAYSTAIPWYIMTSPDNHRATRDFFEARRYFDLPRDDVKFFIQGRMPAVDLEGKLILADRDRLTWNPDGHGGTIRALARSGMLEDMRARGVEHISYFQVDNPLVPPLDPVFLGFHVDADSDMSNKMVRKRDAGEKLGHFGLVGGRLHVVEYSDMPKELAEAKNSDGRLRFEAGSIAIHLIARRFVERLSAGDRVGGPPDTDRGGLPLHRAEKKIPYMDAEGRRHEPDEPNGIKFEMFIFDALPMARNPVVLEIDRAEEFSPVKNADGEDSPATARHDMVRLAARRLEEVGVKVPRDPHGEPRFPVEISPLAAGTPEELRALVRRRGIQAVTGELYLGPEKT